MADWPLSFVHNNNVVAVASGEVAVLLPSSPVREPIAALLTPDPYLLSALVSRLIERTRWRHHCYSLFVDKAAQLISQT
jgi:hypothetical protein